MADGTPYAVWRIAHNLMREARPVGYIPSVREWVGYRRRAVEMSVSGKEPGE